MSLYKILEQLQKNKTPYCFQCQGNFYNISVTDPQGKHRGYNTKDIDQIEQFLEVMWGHLLNNVNIPLPPPRPF